MLNFIVPMFEDLFLRFHGELPSITKTIIALSDSFSKYISYVILLICVLTANHLINRRKIWYRRLSSSVTMKIPVAGPIIKLSYKTRFCQTIKLLIGSKIHLLETL